MWRDKFDKDINKLSLELVAHCLQTLAYYKAPAYIAKVDALPLTSTEKIQRSNLKELALQLMKSNNFVDLRTQKVSR